MTLKQIVALTGGQLLGNDAKISRLLTDSRTLFSPDETLFFALTTAKNDGHRYIEELYQRGVRNFAVTILPEKPLSAANFLLLDNTLVALQSIVAAHRQQFSCPVIGICGSNGKTIVKEWLYRLLMTDYRITRSPRSYNSQIGVPLSVWEMSEQTELAIFEAGVSQPNEMQHLQKIIRPTIGVFTHLGDAHQENFASLKEKINEKLKLFTEANVIIYNKDNKLADIAIQQAGITAKPFTFGEHPAASIRIIKQQIKNRKTEIRYNCPELSLTNENIVIPFTDAASIENAMSCIAVMLYLHNMPEEIVEKIASLEAVAMRLEVKEGMNNCLIINDSYNSDVSSLGIVLDFLREQAQSKQMKKTIILSDILQSGQENSELYQNVAAIVEEKAIDRLIGIGTQIKSEASPIKTMLNASCETHFYSSTEEFLHSSFFLPSLSFSNEAILLKGARSFQFENISEKLQAIAHQTTLEVNLSALLRNVDYFRSRLKPSTKLMSMVKAYAYGSGDIEVARALQAAGADYLAVAVADEGAILRQAGIHLPIVVMNPEIGALGKLFDYRLEAEIYSFRLLDAYLKEALRRGETSCPIHVKIDTGMKRLGFAAEEIDTLIEKLKVQQTLVIRSVFSHLAGSDEAQFDDFTHRQAADFITIAEKFTTAFGKAILKHILNSAGIERFSQYQFDMVRLGIGHYGVSAIANSYLEEVCILKTTILQIRRVAAQATVGYSRKGRLQRDSLIGIIPVGYADGYDRRLGNGAGKVLVFGKLVPVVGNVCMDTCMIDLTDIPDVREGDTAVLFGGEYSLKDMAKTLNTIPYEVLTGISRRVRRVYFRE